MGRSSREPQDMLIEIAFDSGDFKKDPAKCVYYKIEDAEGAIHKRNDFSNASRHELRTAQATLKAVSKMIEAELDTRDEYFDNVRKEIEDLTQTGGTDGPECHPLHQDQQEGTKKKPRRRRYRSWRNLWLTVRGLSPRKRPRIR